MSAVMKYTNMKEIASSCIIRWCTIATKEQIKLNEDNIAHEEDNLFDENSKIRDPQVVIAKGASKGKSTRTCSKCRAIRHTRCACPKNNKSKYVEIDYSNLNEIYGTNPHYSLTNSTKDIGYNNTKLVRQKLMSVMSNFLHQR